VTTLAVSPVHVNADLDPPLDLSEPTAGRAARQPGGAQERNPRQGR
jgi:hypothetical protein